MKPSTSDTSTTFIHNSLSPTTLTPPHPPQKVAWQWKWGGVYLQNLLRPLWSGMEKVGRVWKRLQPMESTRGSPDLRILLYHRCTFIVTVTRPMFCSEARRPPSTTGYEASKLRTNSQGKASTCTRMYVPGRYPSNATRCASLTESNSDRFNCGGDVRNN